MGKLLAICISEKKGTQKHTVDSAVLKEDFGIEGDAHAGKWHRQVSLLSYEKIEEFRARGADVEFGAFGENLIIEGFDCIMPREGVFAKVLKGGKIDPGNEVIMEEPLPDRPFTAAVITLSDRGAKGEREDKSGPLIADILKEKGYDVLETLLLPDGIQPLKNELCRLADQRQVNVIFTTGGTGFSLRDVTPEATEAVCDRKATGIAEAIRQYSLSITPKAMLSRGTSGIRKMTLIINLPGSPKACREDLEYILPALDHGLGILRGTDDN